MARSVLDQFAEVLGLEPDAPELAERIRLLTALVLARKPASGRLHVLDTLVAIGQRKSGLSALAAMWPVETGKVKRP